MAAIQNSDHAELSADHERPREQFRYGVWMSIGGHVVVLGVFAAQKIADAAADKIGLMAEAAELLGHVRGGLGSFGCRNDELLPRLARRCLLGEMLLRHRGSAGVRHAVTTLVMPARSGSHRTASHSGGAR